MDYVKKFEHCFLLFELFISMFVVGSLIFILILLRDNYFVDNLLNISHNLSQKPILDILALEMDETCAEDYENLIQLNFPGTLSGCQCQDFKTYKIGSLCSFQEVYSGCQNVYAKESVKVTHYRNKTVCLKRMKESYIELRKKVFEKCDENSTDCGVFDTLGNHLCLSNRNECPITELIFTSNNNNNSTSYYKYKKIDLKNYRNGIYEDYYLYFSNNDANSSIMSSILMQGIKPHICTNRDFREFTLFRDCDWYDVKNMTCDLGDDSFNEPIDSISGLQFYLNNKIYENSASSICYMEEFYDKYIFASNYHGLLVNHLCMGDETDRFISNVLSRNSIRSNFLSYLEVFKIVLIVVFFGFALIFKWKMYYEQGNKFFKRGIIIEATVSCILFCLSMSLLVEYFLLSKEMRDLTHVLQNKCGDLYIEALAQQLYYYDEITQQNILYAFIFISIGGLIYPLKNLVMHYFFKHIQ